MARFVSSKVVKEFFLQGRKVVFRYPRRGDSEGMVRCINSLVREKAFIGEAKRITYKEGARRLNSEIRKMRKGREIMLCVEIDGKYAGSGRIYRKPLDVEKHVIELRVRLEKPFRKMGVGPQLIMALEDMGKKDMKAKVVELSCLALNRHAAHVYKKLGYKKVGRVPKGSKRGSRYCDDLIMAKVLK
jgi:RimJ/RimL family protein N-acetyltransferase